MCLFVKFIANVCVCGLFTVLITADVLCDRSYNRHNSIDRAVVASVPFPSRTLHKSRITKNNYLCSKPMWYWKQTRISRCFFAICSALTAAQEPISRTIIKERSYSVGIGEYVWMRRRVPSLKCAISGEQASWEADEKLPQVPTETIEMKIERSGKAPWGSTPPCKYL